MIIGNVLSCHKFVVLKVFLIHVGTDSISCVVPKIAGVQ
jgi:hypothetical protein